MRPYIGYACGMTPRRTFRIPDTLYIAALSKATHDGSNLSRVIRDALARYVAAGSK